MTGADRPSPVEAARPPGRRTEGLFVIALVVATGLVSSWPSFGYYWNMDDLHLVRPYSASEIAGTFVGHWDPDGIETVGYRPLTTLFNHARAVAFGESVAAHRLFLLALYAWALSLMAGWLRRLGAPPAAAAAGAVFAIAAKNSYYHYVWVADGVHVLQLFFCVLAARAWHRYVEGGRRTALAATMGWFVTAMLVREDSLAVLPLMAGVGLGLQVLGAGKHQPETAARVRRLIAGAGALGVVLPAWWLVRLSVVSNAPNVKLELASFGRVMDMVSWTVSLVGRDDPLWPAYVALGIAAVLVARRLPAAERRLAWVLLGSALVACAIGNVRARVNLLILPATFYGCFLGVALAGAWRGRAVVRASTALVVFCAIAGAVRASRLEQIDLHPMSAAQIGRDWMFISGRLGPATIPEVRRATLEPKLAAFGLLDPGVDVNAWRESIRAAGRIGPQPDGGVFVATRPFLEPR